jgi:hypothetical protein
VPDATGIVDQAVRTISELSNQKGIAYKDPGFRIRLSTGVISEITELKSFGPSETCTEEIIAFHPTA